MRGLLFFAGRLYPCEGYYCHYENGACGNGIVIPLQAEAAAPRSRRGCGRCAAGSVFLRRGGGERHAFLRSSRAQFRPLLPALLRLNDRAAFKRCHAVCRPARHASRCDCRCARQSRKDAQRRKSRRKFFCEKGVFSVCGGIVVWIAVVFHFFAAPFCCFCLSGFDFRFIAYLYCFFTVLMHIPGAFALRENMRPCAVRIFSSAFISGAS